MASGEGDPIKPSKGDPTEPSKGDPIEPSKGEPIELGEGDPIELRVTPDPYVTVRYAGASGDFNPIHIDEAFAREVGLPGRILHGLWTMAQVARAVTEAAGAAAGDVATAPASLRSLSVQFRGMGAIGEEIAVTGTVTGVEDGVATAKLEAHQSGQRLIRNGRAEIRVPEG